LLIVPEQSIQCTVTLLDSQLPEVITQPIQQRPEPEYHPHAVQRCAKDGKWQQSQMITTEALYLWSLKLWSQSQTKIIITLSSLFQIVAKAYSQSPYQIMAVRCLHTAEVAEAVSAQWDMRDIQEQKVSINHLVEALARIEERHPASATQTPE